MKTWKLVSGIISIVLSVFVVFQSMMAGLANALEESGQSSGSAGLIVSICMLCGGIVHFKMNDYGCMVFLVLDQYNTRNHFIKKRYQKLKLIPFKKPLLIE